MGNYLRRWLFDNLLWEALKTLAALIWSLGVWVIIKNLESSVLARIQLGLFAVILLLTVFREVFVKHSSAKRNANPIDAGTGLRQKFPLTLLDFYPLRDKAPTSIYQFKLRVVFRNDFATPLELTQLRWSAHSEEVQLQPPLNYRFQVEREPGSWKIDAWEPEAKEVVVRPGRAFRFWIGVNPSYIEADIRQRHEVEHVGTVMLSGKVEGKNWELQVRL
jgi:hypothetical protein